MVFMFYISGLLTALSLALSFSLFSLSLSLLPTIVSLSSYPSLLCPLPPSSPFICLSPLFLSIYALSLSLHPEMIMILTLLVSVAHSQS